MRTCILFTFLAFLGVCYGAPLDSGADVINEAEPPHCRLVIEKDGIESEGFVSAWGGSLNQVYCKVECEGKSVAPAIRWYRYTGSKWIKLGSYTNKWSYAVRSYFDTWSILTFPNFRVKDVGRYKCVAWLGGEQGLQTREVDVSYGCPPESFSCDNFMCLPLSKTCDGIQHCKDGRDEDHCTSCDPEDEFSCDDSCIPISERCNGVLDCIDEKDEVDCVCDEATQFTCGDGSCINNTLVCDGFEDCMMDGSDEFPDLCEDEPSSTTTEEIPPQTETTTTKATTTELTTESTTTVTTTTPAPTTTDADYYDYIYGDDDEDGNDDEDNVSDQPLTTQQNGDVDTITTTTPAKVASTIENGADFGPECIPEVEFRCNDGQCIPMDWYCDSYTDCNEKEDETNCTTSQDGCSETEFQCDEGMCIPESSECDGELDCPFGEDEDGCGGCLPYQFMCNDGQCIDIDRRCDTMLDCNDTSDEQDCFKIDGVACLESKIQCADGLKCYSTEQRCDGLSDCLDSSDEKSCTTEKPTASPTTRPTDSPTGNLGKAGVGNGETVSEEITIVETGDGTVVVEEDDYYSY